MKIQVVVLVGITAFAAMSCVDRSRPAAANSAAEADPTPTARHPTLPCAVSDADLSKTKEFVESGVPVDSTEDDCIHMEPSPRGVTLLMQAAYLGKLETAKFLLDHGANANASDTYGRTPVAYGVLGKNLDVIGVLLDKGADINSRAELNRTPLMEASGGGDVHVINYLLDHGARVNAADGHGTSALMFAAGFKQPKAVRALLNRGANPAMKDRRGRTYLTYAKRGFPNEYLILKM